jgi:hypothetical protein
MNLGSSSELETSDNRFITYTQTYTLNKWIECPTTMTFIVDIDLCSIVIVA